MTRKYVPPKKKKNRTVARSQIVESKQAPIAAAEFTPSEFSVDYPAAAKSDRTPVTASGAVQYDSLPSELRRIALVSAITVAVMLVLWFIFR